MKRCLFCGHEMTCADDGNSDTGCCPQCRKLLRRGSAPRARETCDHCRAPLVRDAAGRCMACGLAQLEEVRA